MPTIYISDSGDDRNDGLSLKTSVYSFKQGEETPRAAGMTIAGTSGREHGSESKRSFPTRKRRAT